MGCILGTKSEKVNTIFLHFVLPSKIFHSSSDVAFFLPTLSHQYDLEPKICQVGAKARAVVEEAKGADEEENNGKFKQVPNCVQLLNKGDYYSPHPLSGIHS